MPFGASNPARKRVVMVVDDHGDTREMYVQYLEAEGFVTAEGTTCADALARVRMDGVDALVLDRRLPDGDGTEVCRTLKSDPRTRRIPIIVLSGRAAETPVEADAYLLKPVVPDALVTELRRLLARRDG